jgi:uncharacterized protein
MAPLKKIDVLLRITAQNPDEVLRALESEPQSASLQDVHGYSLLHAATSYGHLELMRALVQKYNVDPNLADEDGESPLFYAESVEVCRCLVEELHANHRLENKDRMIAAEKIQETETDAYEDREWISDILDYLFELASDGASAQASSDQPSDMDTLVARPPMVPDNLQLNFGTMQEAGGQEPDPEFKRRIEELAAKGDLHGEERQKELRDLVKDVVTGMRDEEPRDAQRRRLDE